VGKLWMAICFLLIPLLAVAASPFLPNGYRYPNEQDIEYDWKEFGPKHHVEADFNGDGLQDYAWILLEENRPGWALFVFLGGQDPGSKPVLLEKNLWEQPAQKFSIQVAAANQGTIQTACGKEYFECRPGEPKEINVLLPSPLFCLVESACFIYIWEKKTNTFRRIQLSD
jgi:hypothetical protein